ncbi:HlyD family secretion protein [Altericroceibacterium xinjiangense]|uniref:HlyD family secretion protein n=1 Tax=Altericroceibacterium xinjiangense TaxID=762261 RepID=UPI000F7E5AA3|nr:HlyD family secretion protein [Altericroceibacterium xinjiangense]
MDAQTTAVEQNVEPEKASRRSPRRRRGVRLVLLAILLGLVALGIAWFVEYQQVGKYLESTDDAYIQADAVVVSPKIAGYVEQVFVADNQAVKPGDPLVRIDPRDYRAQAAQAQAQIDIARANAEGVRAQIAEQGAAVQEAQAQLDAAQSDLELARTEVNRYEPLVATGAEPREALTQRRARLQQTQAQVAAARAALEAARRRVGTLEAQVGQTLAQGEAGEAQLSQANVNLGSTVIRATIAGRIGNKSVRAGQFVQPGTRLMSTVPVSQLYVEANFKETQVGLMRVGQPVTIEVDALEGIELAGRVDSFAPGTGAQFSLLPPENATGNFTKIVQRIPVRISIQAPAAVRALLLPGMSVTTTVNTLSAKGSLERIEQAAE